MSVTISEIHIIIAVIVGIIAIVSIPVYLQRRLCCIESEIGIDPPIRERLTHIEDKLTHIEDKIDETQKATQTLKESHDELKDKYWGLTIFIEGRVRTLDIVLPQLIKEKSEG